MEGKPIRLKEAAEFDMRRIATAMEAEEGMTVGVEADRTVAVAVAVGHKECGAAEVEAADGREVVRECWYSQTCRGRRKDHWEGQMACKMAARGASTEPKVGCLMVADEDMAEPTDGQIAVRLEEHNVVRAEEAMPTDAVAEETIPRCWSCGGSSMPTMTLTRWRVWAAVEARGACFHTRASKLGEPWESLVVSPSPLEKQGLRVQRCAPI